MRWDGKIDNETGFPEKGVWHRRFAWTPEQMHCGTWVWFEHYEARVESVRYNRDTGDHVAEWSVRLIGDEWEPRGFVCDPTAPA